MMDDVRYAFRMLRTARGVSAIAILTLALGIGANTAVFGLLNAVLFRDADLPAPDRLAWLAGNVNGGRNRNLSYPEFQAHRAADSVFASLAAYQDVPLALGSGGEPEQVSGLVVTSDYFAVAGLRPGIGRWLSTNDTESQHEVVLSQGLWRRRFGGDSGLVGKSIVVNGRPFDVVGVAPEGFVGLDIGNAADAFVAFSGLRVVMPDSRGDVDNPNAFWLRAIGRLRDGVSMAEADRRVRLTASQYAATDTSFRRYGAQAILKQGELDPGNRADAGPVFALLMAVPMLVLLIACANVANLLLSRAAARRREIAVRLALGAGRWRLVRQLLTESVVLSLIAAAAGTLLAVWLTDFVLGMVGAPPGLGSRTTPDWRVLAFTLAVSVLTGVLFGLAPALGASRPEVVTALKSDAAGSGSRRRSRAMRGFVTAQVALSLVLLVTSGLFLRSLAKATLMDVGFETKQGAAISFDLGLLGYDDGRRGTFYKDLTERAAQLPGVKAVTLASHLPLSGRVFATDAMDAAAPDDPLADRRAAFTMVWPGYLKASGTRLVRGREFTAQDDRSAAPVVVVNETLARRAWPGREAIGQLLRISDGGTSRTVVGVARDGKYDELTEDPLPYFYVPELQRAAFDTPVTLLVRTTGRSEDALAPLRALVREMEPNLPLYDARTLESHVRLRLDKQQAASALLAGFGALALLLATLGLYGVTAFAVAQRTREIGIRLALGADRGEVLGMVLRQGVRFAGLGIVVGLVLSAALTRVVARFLYGVTPTDLVTFAGVAALLLGVAVVASLSPARRATRVDPMVALRSD